MKYALLIIVLSITFLSCAKDTLDIEYLTTGTWILTECIRDYNKDGVYEEDTYAIMSDCDKDNIHTFQIDGSKITDEGPSKCYDEAPQTRTSSWSFSDNQTRLQFDSGNFQIEELTAVTMRLKSRTSYNIIFTIDVKLTFTKQ